MNSWFPVGGTVSEGLGGLKFQKILSVCQYLLVVDPDVRSRLFMLPCLSFFLSVTTDNVPLDHQNKNINRSRVTVYEEERTREYREEDKRVAGVNIIEIYVYM